MQKDTEDETRNKLKNKIKIKFTSIKKLKVPTYPRNKEKDKCC
jgi:hypothetical protein